MRSLCLALVGLLTTLAPANADASIILVHDSSVIGNGSAPQDGFNITRDTDAGLEWLDLTLSTNMSLAAVSSQLGAGGLFEGFRVATDVEVGGLFLSAGAPSINGTGVSFNAAAELLISAVGTTGTNNAGPYGSGFRNPNTAPSGFRSVSQYGDFNPPYSHPFTYVAAGYVADAATSDTGAWLVRNTAAVPEPLSLLVWGSLATGAAGTVACRRRGARRCGSQVVCGAP